MYTLLVSIVILCVTSTSWLFQVVSCDSEVHGPFLTELLSVKKDDFLERNKPREIKLVDYPNFSVIVPLLSGRSNGTLKEVQEALGGASGRRFIVEALPNHGVMAVVQKMKFGARTANNTTCSNFLEFDWDACSNFRTNKTKIICGDATQGKESFPLPKTFNSMCEKMAVNFSMDINSEEKDVELEIVFTAFKYCDLPSPPTNFTYRACKGNNVCISQNLFCDGINNCGTMSGVGYDERNCNNSKNWTSSLWLYQLAANLSSAVASSRPQRPPEFIPRNPSSTTRSNWAQFFCSILVFALFFAAIFFMMGVIYCVTNCCCLNSKTDFSARPVGLRYRISSIVNCSRGSHRSNLALHRREEICLDEAPPAYDSLFPHSNDINEP